MGFFKIRNDCTKNVMKNKKRQYKGGKMTTRQTFTAFLIVDNECIGDAHDSQWEETYKKCS